MLSWPDRMRRRVRRAAVVVQVAVFSVVMIGMAALAIDVGAMYMARAELQAAVDTAALAAAAELAGDGVSDPSDLARIAADEFARRNAVMGTHAGVDMQNDVELGRAVYDPASERFTFTPGGTNFDAVRVTVRRSEGSEGGPLQLTFAHIFGRSGKDLWARSAAVLVPRDIAVVIDLSNSMNWDSQLRFWDRADGGYPNLRDVWAALDGPQPSRPYIPGSELETEYAGDTGPTVGAMTEWGDTLLPGSYDPASDPGLWLIRRNSDCTEGDALLSLMSRGYSGAENAVLMDGGRDNNYSYQWRNRAAVILGLAEWHSGKAGGYSPGGGDGDNYVESSELSWIPTPNFRVDWSWSGYINWVRNASVYVNDKPDLRYRYGLKTFTDFLLDSEPSFNETNNLWATPQQPLRAVKDAVQTMTNVMSSLESLDKISLEIFASTARHEVDLSDDYQAVPDMLYQRQSGHYDRSTNMGAGLASAIAELQSPRARASSKKIIVLMSDGVANVDEYGSSGEEGAADYALAKAREAADLGIKVYSVSVGYNVDRDLLQQIATVTGGQEFYASGNPEEYSEQLELIFRTLGGKRPVVLIE